MTVAELFGGELMNTLALIAIAITALYFARAPMRGLISSMCRALAQGLRFASQSLVDARTNLTARNREVLLAAGRDAAARMVEREFERFGDTVRRDLGQYPSLHQALAERASNLDDDYAKSTATAPSPPGWAEAVEAVAAVPAKADPVLRQVLESIHGSFKDAADEASDDYRKDCRTRHKFLHDMAPSWRESLKLLGEVKTRLETANTRAASVDQHMKKYEEISADTDRAAAALQSSALVQFFVAGLVLVIAAGGAVVNFHLIARPMSEMVGGNALCRRVPHGRYRSALVIILVELSMGLFVMECLRITNLVPCGQRACRTTYAAGWRWLRSVCCSLSPALRQGWPICASCCCRMNLPPLPLLRGDGRRHTNFLPLDHHRRANGHGFYSALCADFRRDPARNFRPFPARCVGLDRGGRPACHKLFVEIARALF